jgi:hypothetical protein
MLEIHVPYESPDLVGGEGAHTEGADTFCAQFVRGAPQQSGFPGATRPNDERAPVINHALANLGEFRRAWNVEPSRDVKRPHVNTCEELLRGKVAPLAKVDRCDGSRTLKLVHLIRVDRCLERLACDADPIDKPSSGVTSRRVSLGGGVGLKCGEQFRHGQGAVPRRQAKDIGDTKCHAIIEPVGQGHHVGACQEVVELRRLERWEGCCQLLTFLSAERGEKGRVPASRPPPGINGCVGDQSDLLATTNGCGASRVLDEIGHHREADRVRTLLCLDQQVLSTVDLAVEILKSLGDDGNNRQCAGVPLDQQVQAHHNLVTDACDVVRSASASSPELIKVLLHRDGPRLWCPLRSSVCSWFAAAH